MGHTQGTWRVTGTGTIRYIDVSVGNGMVQEVATCMHTEYGDMEANARRIVACVNACEGLATEQLEQFGLGTAFGTALFDVTAERDQLQSQLATERASLFAENQRKQQLEQQVEELVAVLERIIGACDACVADDGKSLVDEFTEEMEAAARAVIQKVRGGE